MTLTRTPKLPNFSKKTRNDYLVPFLFILPAFAFISVFSFYPFIKTIVATFTIEGNNGLQWVGLELWKMAFTGSRMGTVLKNTFVFAGLNFVFTFFGALFLALYTVERGKGQRVVETLFSLPMAIASAPAAAVWSFIFQQDGGLLNGLFNADIGWLTNPKLVLVSISIVTSWTHVASNYILLLAGFRNVPQSLIEAARIDGAGPVRVAFSVKIPVASPQIFYVLFINIITALRTFTQINLLTGGGPGISSTTIMYEVYVKSSELYGIACCDAIILFLIVFFITRVQFVFEKKLVYYQ